MSLRRNNAWNLINELAVVQGPVQPIYIKVPEDLVAVPTLLGNPSIQVHAGLALQVARHRHQVQSQWNPKETGCSRQRLWAGWATGLLLGHPRCGSPKPGVI